MYNVLGVLPGDVIGNVISATGESGLNHTLPALGVVCITLVMLLPLNNRLSKLFRIHIYLTAAA